MSFSKRLINTKAAGDANFNTVLFTGNGSAQSITGVGFEPDLVWWNNRDNTSGNQLQDSIRGAGNKVYSSSTAISSNDAQSVTSFDSNGFSIGTSSEFTGNCVAWCWKAGGPAVTNTDGTTTSQVSANTEAGFSVVSWTSTASTSTIGHGLGNAPSVIFMRSITNAGNWPVYNSVFGASQQLTLNRPFAAQGSAAWNYTSPSSSVINSGFTNQGDVIAYCWAEIAGFSKFGSYTGNGNGSLDASGSVVVKTITTGFEPAFVVLKGDANYWGVFDNKRGGSSPGSQWKWLWPGRAKSESNASYGYSALVDFTPTGFTLGNDASADWNANGVQYIYMAFANEF
tara:strand:+ start:1227 stop:2249 length:1023 start_codon:yes stop_codon:yes gene_type:complete